MVWFPHKGLNLVRLSFWSQIHHAVEEQHHLLSYGYLLLLKLPNGTVHNGLYEI
jgi:hypothetical protein